MISKFILPWFGGTPAVWSTAMLFFQVFLTGGYAYAYWLVKQTKQRWIHLGLLVMAVVLLLGLGTVWESPITPSASLRPADVGFPVLSIFIILSVSVGLPYFALASNGPLMQAWFSRLQPGFSYARLYALSNVGSLLGLLAYPVLVEPNMLLQQQGWIWTIGFILFAIISILIVSRLKDERLVEVTSSEARQPASMYLLWLILSGTASLFLLAVSNQITQEVAAIPFLWVLPLVIYLLTFILAFSDTRWYDRRLFALLFALVSIAYFFVFAGAGARNLYLQISVPCLLLFIVCMICHSELYQVRPSANQLTSFYLMVSLGGAAGGVFVNFVAPFIFRGYWEFNLGWMLAGIIMIIRLYPAWQDKLVYQTRTILLSFPVGVLMILLGFNVQSSEVLLVERNFYGVIRVTEGKDNTHIMSHGITIHGVQDLNNPRIPGTYFTEDSGVGLLLSNHPKYGNSMRVGVLGLGVGSLAAYGQIGDEYRLYEINDIVIRLAEGEGDYFTFMKDSPAKLEVVPGDARISLETELKNSGSRNFDVLILDAFSSDSIPIHLVTKEAFELYIQHLSPDGIIAANISNRHVDMQPVMWQLAQELNLSMLRINRDPLVEGDYPSQWVILSRDSKNLDIPQLRENAIDLTNYSTDVPLWTDNYSNLFLILK